MCAVNLGENDVRAIIRLLGETAIGNSGLTEKKRFLMDGLCKLVKVDTWVWALGCQIEAGGPQNYVSFMHAGFDDERFSKLLLALEHPDSGPLAAKFYENVAAGVGQVTMRREEIDPNYGEEYPEAAACWEAADIGSLILSSVPLDEDSISSIALYRRVGDAPFSERDKMIVHVLLGEISWMHMLGWPEDRGAQVPKLYPRQRIVLNLLLEGLARKQIAEHMGIKENTVSGYVKDIYKHFSVGSHAELMSKFMHTRIAS